MCSDVNDNVEHIAYPLLRNLRRLITSRRPSRLQIEEMTNHGVVCRDRCRDSCKFVGTVGTVYKEFKKLLKPLNGPYGPYKFTGVPRTVPTDCTTFLAHRLTSQLVRSEKQQKLGTLTYS